MSKTRLVPNLMIFGTAFSLLALSAGPNIMPAYAAAADTGYIAPENSPTVRPLGQTTTTTTVQAPAPQMAGANDDNAAPLQPVQSGNVTYITGGIGDEERTELQSVKGQYNLHIMSATRNGAFVGDTRVVILDKNGGEVVNTTAGPLFLAKLPDGRYTIQATHENTTKEQKVTIRHGNTANVHLSW